MIIHNKFWTKYTHTYIDRRGDEKDALVVVKTVVLTEPGAF